MSEEALRALFEPFEGVVAFRIVRDRGTGACRGFAFLDMESEAAAEAVLVSEARGRLRMDGWPVKLDYARASHQAYAADGGAGGGSYAYDGRGDREGGFGGGGGSDWVCENCQAVNFGRRGDCFRCSAPVTATAQRVAADPDLPSRTLRVGGLEAQAKEEALHYHFAPTAPGAVASGSGGCGAGTD